MHSHILLVFQCRKSH